MTEQKQKIVKYLDEAHATEAGLVRVLQSQIAMAPRGSYRTVLERHLDETRGHAQRIEERLGELGHGGSRLQAGIGTAQTVFAQALAVGKVPLDLLRGSGLAEKTLKNAKDTAATEALEIATYTAIEQLARDAGDEETAKLAASIRAEEQRMLERVLAEIPKLTDAVAAAESSAGVKTIGAADAARKAARKTTAAAKRARGTEPWPGYDEQNVDEIRSALAGGDEAKARLVRDYERAHKQRAGVLEAAERELTSS